MVEKVKVLLSSIRFWQVLLGSAAAYAGWVEAHGFDLGDLLTAVAGFLGVVAGVGTLDKMSSGKVNVEKATVTGVEVTPSQE